MNSGVGLLVVLVHLWAVVASIPAALLVYGLAGYLDSITLAFRYVGVELVVLIVLVAVAIGVLFEPGTGATVLALALAGLVVLAAVPLSIGRRLLERWTPLDRDETLEYATLGLPVALVASFALFVAPGGPGRSDLTVLSGPVSALIWVVICLVIACGPGVVGFGLYRLLDRLG